MIDLLWPNGFPAHCIEADALMSRASSSVWSLFAAFQGDLRPYDRKPRQVAGAGAYEGGEGALVARMTGMGCEGGVPGGLVMWCMCANEMKNGRLPSRE